MLADDGWQVPAGYTLQGWHTPEHQRRVGGAIRRYVEDLRDRGLVAITTTSTGRRRVLTEAGHAHYTAHHATYRERWPDICAPGLP